MLHSLVQRGLIALVLVLAMAVWFSASAVVPALASQWHLSAAALGLSGACCLLSPLFFTVGRQLLLVFALKGTAVCYTMTLTAGHPRDKVGAGDGEGNNGLRGNRSDPLPA